MSPALAAFLTFHKDIDDNDLLQHAIHMDVINARSTSSGLTARSQVSEESRRFREALEERDVHCVMTTLGQYQATHIIPYAHENAVSQYPILVVTEHKLHLISGLRSSFTAVHITMKMSPILHSMMSVMGSWSPRPFIPTWNHGRLHF